MLRLYTKNLKQHRRLMWLSTKPKIWSSRSVPTIMFQFWCGFVTRWPMKQIKQHFDSFVLIALSCLLGAALTCKKKSIMAQNTIPLACWDWVIDTSLYIMHAWASRLIPGYRLPYFWQCSLNASRGCSSHRTSAHSHFTALIIWMSRLLFTLPLSAWSARQIVA